METVHVIALTREEARERMNESVKYQRRRVAIDRRDRRRRVNAFGQESGGAVAVVRVRPPVSRLRDLGSSIKPDDRRDDDFRLPRNKTR